SYHTKAMAVDLRSEGRSLEQVREAALSLQCGGVGYYPRSGFVHVDCGPIRRWLRAVSAHSAAFRNRAWNTRRAPSKYMLKATLLMGYHAGHNSADYSDHPIHRHIADLSSCT